METIVVFTHISSPVGQERAESPQEMSPCCFPAPRAARSGQGLGISVLLNSSWRFLEIHKHHKGDRGVIQLYFNKCRASTGAHPAGFFLSWGFGGLSFPFIPNSQPCCPLPFPTAWGTGKVQPSQTFHTFPPWASCFIPKFRNSSLCSPLSLPGAKLGEEPAPQSQQRP